MNEYIGIAVSFVLAGGIAAAMVALGSTLGKKYPTSEKRRSSVVTSPSLCRWGGWRSSSI